MQGRRKIALTAGMVLLLSACSHEEKSPSVKTAEKIVTAGQASGPMPASGFKATITSAGPPGKMRAGEKATITVKVKNEGDAPWPSHGRASDGFFQVNLGDIWFDANNKKVEKNTYIRSGLPHDVASGEEVEVSLAITAPSTPGQYTVQLDLVQEMVAWFSEKGSPTPKFKVTVGG